MTLRRTLAIVLVFALTDCAPLSHQLRAQATSVTQTTTPVVLTRDQAAAILPPSVFFRGQSAPIQGRNSAGLKLSGGKLILTALVDTSGYSTALQQTYQACLITESPLLVAGQRLAPGAYGFGFIASNKLTLMDLGGNEILHATTTHDEALKRPTPLQILPDPSAASFRLYLGRTFITFSPADK
jgi:hypothetical protein